MNVQNQDFEFSVEISVLRYPKLENVGLKNIWLYVCSHYTYLDAIHKKHALLVNIGARNYFEQFWKLTSLWEKNKIYLKQFTNERLQWFYSSLFLSEIGQSFPFRLKSCWSITKGVCRSWVWILKVDRYVTHNIKRYPTARIPYLL